VVAAQGTHHLLRLGGFRKRCEAPEIEVDDRDFAPAADQRIVGFAVDDELGQMGREEALEARQPVHLQDALPYPLLERARPLPELRGLSLRLVVQPLDAQQGTNPREELLAVDGLGEEIVGSRLQTADAFLLGVQRGDHHDRQHRVARVGANPATGFEAVEAGHDDVEEDEVGPLRGNLPQGFFAALGGADLVAVESQDVVEQRDVGCRVIDHEDSRGRVRLFGCGFGHRGRGKPASAL
jgi:hypothetical protein